MNCSHTDKYQYYIEMLVTCILLLVLSVPCAGEVITNLGTKEKVVCLTFDGCETKTPSYLDVKILNYLIDEKLPFTLFVSGKFAKRNFSDLAELAKNDLVSIQNHSLSHINHMEKLPASKIYLEVNENQKIIEDITGSRPIFFRFPAGNYSPKALDLVESLGYAVVHWSFPSGDPDRNLTAEKMTTWVLSKVKPGSILIFHINGRGYHTGEALPKIVRKLRNQGYRFVRLEDYLSPRVGAY